MIPNVAPPPARWIRRIVHNVPLPEYPRDRRTIAIHEAGHAVAMAAFGVPVERVEIHQTADGGFGGSVEPDRAACRARIESPDGEPTPNRSLEEFSSVAMATIYVAGIQAELLHHGLDVSGTLRLDDHDHREAVRHLMTAFRSDGPLWYTQRLARYLLSKRWNLVVALADELMAADVVTSEEE